MTYRDTFKGTAWYYARYRTPYPDSFFDLLVRMFGLDGTGRLLDLGCGAGQIAVPLAPHFEEVVAMDPEPEMLGELARVASEVGAKNIRLVEGGSGDLEDLRDGLGIFRLATLGSCFHWMDRESTLASLARMIIPGGGLVVAGMGSFWTNDAPWCMAVKETVKRWLGEERRAGSSTFQELVERHETIIDRSRFGPCRVSVEHFDQVWTVEEIIGHLYSTSFCSPWVLGERKAGFEEDLRRTLLGLNTAGRFAAEVALEILMGERAKCGAQSVAKT